MTETQGTPQDPFPFACNLHAVPAALRSNHTQNTRTLFGQMKATLQLEDGYQFHFHNTPELIQTLGHFISLESQCCAFFTFELHVPSGQETVVLDLKGPAGVQGFIESTFLSP